MAHDVSTSQGREIIDGRYIANVLADDWGFWYDATCNLNTVKSFVNKFYSEGKLTSEEQNIIMNRIDKLLKIIEEEPKAKNWLKRARIGTSKPWYREVEEIVR
ncbi:MAG: hypothetical protein QXS79_02465 [Candidatus Bathyarchaeia archaeon]